MSAPMKRKAWPAQHAFRLHKLVSLILGCLLFTLEIKAQPAQSIEIIPPRIEEFVLESGGVQRFRVKIKPLGGEQRVIVLFETVGQTAGQKIPPLELFSERIKWERFNNGLVYTGIDGKPKKVSLSGEGVALELYYRIPPKALAALEASQETKGDDVIVEGRLVVADLKGRPLGEAAVRFKRPPKINTIVEAILEIVAGHWRGLGAGAGGLFLVWLLARLIRRQKEKNREAPSAATGRFSALLKPNETMVIKEHKNPFQRRLSGLGNGLKIYYNGSSVAVSYFGKEATFGERDKSEVQINDSWKLVIEVQKLADGEEEVKRVRVLMIPVSELRPSQAAR